MAAHCPQPPGGDAVIDRRGRIRYRTLDGAMSERLDEVETIVRADAVSRRRIVAEIV